MILEAIVLPPEIIDGLMTLAGAIIGWFARWLAGRRKTAEIKEQNEKLKEVVIQYDTAAREALRSARKPIGTSNARGID